MRPLSFITAAVAAACFVAPITLHAQATATATTVTCKDGSTSKAGKGACSHHGGVNKSAAASSATTSPAPAASPSSSPAPAAAAATTPPKGAASTATAGSGASENNDPTGAIAKCKDGLYSHSKHRSGTCSKHGGVAQWLQPK